MVLNVPNQYSRAGSEQLKPWFPPQIVGNAYEYEFSSSLLKLSRLKKMEWACQCSEHSLLHPWYLFLFCMDAAHIRCLGAFIYNPYIKSLWLLSSLFYRWGNWGSERWAHGLLANEWQGRHLNLFILKSNASYPPPLAQWIIYHLSITGFNNDE